MAIETPLKFDNFSKFKFSQFHEKSFRCCFFVKLFFSWLPDSKISYLGIVGLDYSWNIYGCGCYCQFSSMLWRAPKMENLHPPVIGVLEFFHGFRIQRWSDPHMGRSSYIFSEDFVNLIASNSSHTIRISRPKGKKILYLKLWLEANS